MIMSRRKTKVSDDQRAEKILAAARADKNNPPLEDRPTASLGKPRPRVFVMRRALKMTQDEFAEAFGIPVGTLRDWEQGRAEPDQAARSYLRVIASNPDLVRKALARVPA
jgi:putative transcriptional regulator